MTEQTLEKNKKKIKISNLHEIGLLIALILVLLLFFSFSKNKNLNECFKILPLISIRSFLELLATIFFLTALINMPFANVNAILQSLPLTITIAASIFLKESFGLC